MVFGVFDRLHEGHRSFLAQAWAHGDELIVIVARDEVVRRLKQKRPHESQDIRISKLKMLEEVSAAALGDENQGTYTVIAQYNPDVICVGYDQDGLHDDLMARIEREELPKKSIVRLYPYKPETYHSSLF